jgi:hypothetical protein
MALQTIGLGSSANDGSGDTLRAAGTKINANTGEIYARFGSGSGNGATLETATSANILVGNGTKFASVATSGDFNISSAGAINVRTDSSGVSKITIPSGSAPGTTTNTLYNIGGALYFNGSVVGSGNVTGMTAFSVAGDSGSAQSITQGNTVTIAGGTGIASVASATDTITLNIDSTVATLTGTQELTNKTLTSPSVSGLTLSDASIVLEGATADDFETTLTVTDPTADRTITFPDATGTVALTSDITVTASSTTAFTNKTIDANGTGNSITNLEVADFAAASVVTQSEGIGSNNNDTTIPTSAAVKAYADSVGGGSITVQDEGSALSTGATTLNFVGAGVTATGSGATKTITVGAGVSTLAALTDTAISSAAAGNILLHDGSDSFDNKVVKSNDITLAHTTALAIPMGGFTFGPISASGTDHYVFANYTSGGADSNDPHLYLLSDMAYIFDLSGLGGAHPFQIESGGSALTTSNGADGLIHIATNGTVTTGTSANAKTSGLLIWKVPHFATASTSTYTYQCTSHTNMQGAITIKTLETLS